MRVLIVEPFLKDPGGHQFAYSAALQAELERRGVTAIILGSISARPDSLKLNNFYPLLSDVSSCIFQSPLSFLNLPGIWKRIKRLRDELDKFLARKDLPSPAGRSLWFLHTFYIFDLLAFGWFLKKRKEYFLHRDDKFFIGCNFSYRRALAPLTWIMALLYRSVFLRQIRGLESKMVFFSDGAVLMEQYQKLLDREVVLFPLPIAQPRIEDRPGEPPAGSSPQITISSPGGVRLNKGFDLLVEAIARLADDPLIRQRVKWMIQVDIQPNQSRRDARKVARARRALENLARQYSNIELFEGPLGIDEYYARLRRSDLVALPYSSAFKYAHSQILREVVVAGKVPLVSAGTTLARDLAGDEELIFDPRRPGDLAATIRKAVAEFPDCRKKLEKIREAWKREQTVTRLVDRLLSPRLPAPPRAGG